MIARRASPSISQIMVSFSPLSPCLGTPVSLGRCHHQTKIASATSADRPSPPPTGRRSGRKALHERHHPPRSPRTNLVLQSSAREPLAEDAETSGKEGETFQGVASAKDMKSAVVGEPLPPGAVLTRGQRLPDYGCAMQPKGLCTRTVLLDREPQARGLLLSGQS